MGIDVYLRWDGMTKEERDGQFGGFITTIGNRGYLREAYHGEPYATRILFPECFDDGADQGTDEEGYGKGLPIPNEELLKRLPDALTAARIRERKLYRRKGDDILKSIQEFVALHGRKEKAGLNPRIYVSY